MSTMQTTTWKLLAGALTVTHWTIAACVWLYLAVHWYASSQTGVDTGIAWLASLLFLRVVFDDDDSEQGAGFGQALMDNPVRATISFLLIDAGIATICLMLPLYPDSSEPYWGLAFIAAAAVVLAYKRS